MPQSDENVSTQSVGTLEDRKEAGKGPAGVVAFWKQELELSEAREKVWRKKARNAIERYRYDDKTDGVKKHNILYSNTNTIKAIVYNRVPSPDVRRRFRDADPTGKEVAEILERSLSFTLDAYDFDGMMKDTVHDATLPGRGIDRVYYRPSYETVEAVGEEGEEGYEEAYDKLAYEEVECEHVNWSDIRFGQARTWKKMPWVAQKWMLSRKELKAKFPAFPKVDTIEMDNSRLVKPEDEDQSKADQKHGDTLSRLLVWEIFDKEKREVVFIAPSYEDAPLKVEEDKLELEGFFPYPEPLLAVKQSDTMVPVCEYTMYKDQAEELDIVTDRLKNLISACKVRGVYNTQIGSDIGNVLESAENVLTPTKNPVPEITGGGLEKNIWFFPLDIIANVIQILSVYREALKNEIYEIIGLSDIMRGVTDPNETLGAQRIKANYGGTKTDDRKAEVQRYARDLIRLKAEVMANHFQPQTFQVMTNRPITDEVMAMMRNDGIRSFRVDIETDTTIAADEAEERQNIVELVSSIAKFVQEMGPAVQSGMIPGEAAKALLMASVRRFKLGRQVEDILDELDTQGQGGQEGQQAPDPAQIQQMVQEQAQQMAMQMENVLKQQEETTRAQTEAQEAQAQQEQNAREMQQKAQLAQQDSQTKAMAAQAVANAQIELEKQKAQAKIQLERQVAQAKIEIERFKAEQDAMLKKETAKAQQCQCNNEETEDAEET
jgi:hypothetical protein